MAGNNGGPQQPGGIREVARLAGVSVASASFALNGQPGVAEHTRQRMLAAAEQLGYRANPKAQALRRGRTTTYGFVVRNFANPFFLDVLGGAEEVAEGAGATVLILDSRYSLERESMHVREMSAQRLAGLAIAPVGNGESIRLWQNLRDGAPVVALNATADNIRGVSRVGPDNAAAVSLPMHRLAELGHSSVAFVSAPHDLMADPHHPGVWRAHLISRAAETQRFVLAANVAHDSQHCPTMIVSPRGQVLAEAPAGTAATLALTIDLADTRDAYLRQQRDDVVSIAWHD
jgi:LacI family transcriptional regulator